MTQPLSDTPDIRLFEWDDLPALYDLMRRAGEPPYPFADDPMEALGADLHHPRTDALRDIFVADANKSLVGWVRLSLELNIHRATATPGADPAHAKQILWTNLLQAATARSRQAGVELLHVPIPANGGELASAAASLGLRPVRVYYAMDYRPAPAYLRGDYRPLPEGYSVRAMAQDEMDVLTSLQNTAFENSWGYSPNTIEEITGWLSLPGTGADSVLFAVNRDDRPVAYVWTRFEPSEGISAGYIGMTGVHPDHRRAGLGTVIVASGIRRLREQGAGIVRLEVDRDNRPARKLYRDLGFRRTAETIWYELRLEPTNGG